MVSNSQMIVVKYDSQIIMTRMRHSSRPRAGGCDGMNISRLLDYPWQWFDSERFDSNDFNYLIQIIDPGLTFSDEVLRTQVRTWPSLRQAEPGSQPSGVPSQVVPAPPGLRYHALDSVPQIDKRMLQASHFGSSCHGTSVARSINSSQWRGPRDRNVTPGRVRFAATWLPDRSPSYAYSPRC